MLRRIRRVGYYPVVCSIDKLPMYMENRKSNTPSSYRQLEVIPQTIKKCSDQHSHIGRFRADTCYHEKDTMVYLESLPTPLQYYIDADMNTSMRIALEDETEWQEALLNHKRLRSVRWSIKYLAKINIVGSWVIAPRPSVNYP